MTRQALLGMGIGLALLILMMAWVQLMVVPALRPEREDDGATLPSDQLGAPAPDSHAKAPAEPSWQERTRGPLASGEEPRQSPALFDAEDRKASNGKTEANGPSVSSDHAEAEAKADQVIERMRALAADGSADPEKMAGLVGELRRNASGQIADEVDLAQMEQHLRQAARVQQFANKMSGLKPGANAEDRERAMKLSNKMVADMTTQPVFDNVEVPAEVALPGGGDETVITPSLHLNPQAPLDTMGSE